MKNIKFMKSTERCLQCGSKLKDLKSKFCSKDCKCKYESL